MEKPIANGRILASGLWCAFSRVDFKKNVVNGPPREIEIASKARRWGVEDEFNDRWHAADFDEQ